MNDKIFKDMESTLTGMIGELKLVTAKSAIQMFTESIYLDYTEEDNSRWLALITNALKTAKTFETHCWNEETEWIELALRYGKLKDDAWKYGKIITGDVTPQFTEMLLNLPKPTDTACENKMTPFFNVFLDDTFQSCHYGTEVFIKPIDKAGKPE